VKGKVKVKVNWNNGEHRADSKFQRVVLKSARESDFAPVENGRRFALVG
jgi:hypothetical protein